MRCSRERSAGYVAVVLSDTVVCEHHVSVPVDPSTGLVGQEPERTQCPSGPHEEDHGHPRGVENGVGMTATRVDGIIVLRGAFRKQG